MPPSKKAQIAYLKTNEAPTKVSSEYTDFAGVFLPKLAAKQPKHTRINNHAIELVDNQQPSYGPIYSLDLLELEILKTYIENNLANNFIRSSKFPTAVSILFNKKPEGNLQLCVNYRGLNNLIIKNQYLLSLIGISLDRLDWAQ